MHNDVARVGVGWSGGRGRRELSELQHSVRVFGIPDINQKYDVLRQLANVFVVRPDNLKMLLSDGPLSTIDRSVVLVRWSAVRRR